MTNDTYNTTISYESLNLEVLSNSGIYTRPYIAENVVYEVTIKYGSSTKICTYELEVEGFKELNNIAATYIGGGSSTYSKANESLFEICDIIYCGFAYPSTDGTFNNTTIIPSIEGSINYLNYGAYLPAMETFIIDQAHDKGTRVIISICGVEGIYDEAFEIITADDKLTTTFIDNIIDLVNSYGFDGVDIDWETPDNDELFTKFMQKLYTAVKINNPHHLVTAAIGGGMWAPPKYDLTNSQKYIDYINLMTYNMATSSGYHHTALYKSSSSHNTANNVAKTLGSCSIDESIDIYNELGVPSSKIIIGSGFYGIRQNRENVTDSFSKASNPSYVTIKSTYLSDTQNYTRYYDHVSQVPYILSKDGLTFISYEDEESIAAKCSYAKSNNLAGIFAWHYGHDDGDLLNAFKVGMSK